MKKKLLLLITLSFLSNHVLRGQTENAYTTFVIEEQNYERNADTVGFYLNRAQTLSNYLRGSFLYVHDELQDQLDTLIVNSPLPQNPLTGAEVKTVLEKHVAFEAQIAAKLEEINLVAKAAKIQGKAFARPHQLFSDWHLRSKHHELAKAYAANEKFAGENWNTFKPVYENALAALETELQERGFFPRTAKIDAEVGKLLDHRFALVEEFNRVARQEAMNFVDASPRMIENRARMAEISIEVDQIDEKLGILADNRAKSRALLTEATILFRLETLEYGKRSAEMKHNVMRHSDSDVQLLIVKIDEQLAEEKKWLYMEKNHQVIGKGYSTRGPPPGDSPNFDFEDNPFPKKYSLGGTLGDFINETKVASIGKNKQKAFERIVNQWAERFKAINFNSPRWADYQFQIKSTTRSYDFTSLESILRSQAKCYSERLPTSPVEAIKHKAIFETIATEVFGKGKAPKMAYFFTERPVELIQYKHNLEQRIAMLGPYAGAGEQLELIEIEKHIKEILNRDKITVKLDFKMGINRNRPPPSFEELVLKIYEAEVAGLKEMAAQKGSLATPPSVEVRLKEIEKIRTVNKVATSLNGYHQFAEVSDLYELIRYLTPESELVKNFDAGRQAWATEFDNIFKKVSYSGSVELPTNFYEKAKNVQNSLSAGKKATQAKLPSRPPQGFGNFEAMNLRKTPGGIWLSPKSFKIKPQSEFEFNWTLVENEEGCPDDDVYYSEWMIDSLGYKKICFPENEIQLNTQHWLNQIHSW